MFYLSFLEFTNLIFIERSKLKEQSYRKNLQLQRNYLYKIVLFRIIRWNRYGNYTLNQ